MKKNYFLSFLLIITIFITQAQTVSPVLINMKQLSDIELTLPKTKKPCQTCGEKENDGGWKKLKDMPVPKDAIVKKQLISGLKPLTPNQPLSASPTPNRTFLGHVDAGQSIPPDTHGAVGPNHVVTATNDFLIVHTKTGTVLTTVAINTFSGVPGTCDPYIQYDPESQRFFYVAIDCGGQNNNKMAILVSATSDPSGNWFRYSFTPTLPNGAFFLDHPYLGFDNRWLVVSGRKFPDATSFSGPVLFVFDKANLTGNGPITFGTNAQAIEKTPSDGDSPLPVTAYGSNPNPNTFYVLQNWNSNSSTIRLSTITGNIPNATWNTTSAVFPSGGSSYTSSPGDIAEQSGEARKLATNDARISSGVLVNGKIWCAQHIGITDNNVAVQWWQLNAAPGASFGNILQRGRIGEGTPNNYRWFPSIAVNSSEDVIIGYTVSTNISNVSSAYSFRTNQTPANTTLEENIYKVGLSTYYKTFGGTRARWGDYSHSAIDPVDESLWTIQEYADQRTGTGDNNSRFGVWWAQVAPVSSLVQRDAGIGAIINPVAGLLCNPVITAAITIRNSGRDTLKTVSVGMLLDGLPVGIINNVTDLNLTTFSTSKTITITPGFTPAPGLHTLKVYTKDPNGNTDLKTSNDTATVVFSIAGELALPYTESFETAVFPPSNGSAVINGNAGSITWARTVNAGNPGNASILMNGFNYTNNGQRDIYRTPVINAAILDSVVVNFNVAYKQFAGSSDSLLLVYSPDCGVTWLRAGYAKGGAGLSTSTGTTTASFVPTTAEWRTEKVVLKDFCKNNLQKIMIGFQSYNDNGNNIYIDGIQITGFASAQRNIVLNTINGPSVALCTNSLTPAVSFTNAGNDTIRSLKINYQIDGGAITTFNWTGSLPKCSSMSQTLGSAVSTIGTHILKVFTSDPNGLVDQTRANDTLTRTFTIYNTTPLPTPVVEGFESAPIPTNNWGIQNLDALKTWERSTDAARTGTASLLINNPAAGNATNATDNFASPNVANNAAIDSMFVSWDYAYQPGTPFPGSSLLPQDTLEIFVTQDCGVSFTSVWKKWGPDLQTVTAPANATAPPFVPVTVNEWKTARVYLTPVVASNTFQVYFSAKSNKQNNLWIDNVNISSKTLPQRLKNQGYLIYPNPFQSSFLLHHFQPPVQLQALQVFNSAGQLVWDKRFNNNATTETTINLGNLSRGVYILKMIYSNKTIVERIVKQ